MKYLVFLLVFQFSIAAYALDNNDIDTSGDVLRVLIPAAALAAGYAEKDAEGRMQFYKSFALNAGATYGLKKTVRKERPDGSGNDAFPSGHTSMAFQGAAFLQKRYGLKYGLPAYAASFYTGWTRLHADEHSESDILAGAVIGVGSALFFTTRYDRVAVTPVVGRDFYGMKLSLLW